MAKFSATPRQDLWKYSPLVEMLEGRESPGNSTLGPTGFTDPMFGAGAAGLAITGSPISSGSSQSAYNFGGYQYQGYTIPGQAPTGGTTTTTAAATGSGQNSSGGGFEFYQATAAAGTGSSSGSTGSAGSGFGGSSIQGTGLTGSANLPGGGGTGGDSQAALTQAVTTTQATAPAAANAPTALNGGWIDTTQSDMFWTVTLKPGVDAGVFAASVGGVNQGATGILANQYVIKFAEGANAKQVTQALSNNANVTQTEQMVRRQVRKNLVPNDEFFFLQHHLRNTAQFGGLAGADANVVPVFDEFQGRNVTIGIVDDGVEYTHEDLAPNYDAANSFDYLQGDFDAFPVEDESHGTSVAGVAAARGFNGIGVSGAAPLAQIAGLRLISEAEGGISPFQIANSLNHSLGVIDIYNNSWGKADPDTFALMSDIELAALRNGTTNGRGGLGNIYVFSAGNSHLEGSTANHDELKTNQYVIDVGSLDNFGVKTNYSEEGANLFISAYSDNGGAGGQFLGITTTARDNSYIGLGAGFSGTSSAAPLVSGVIALVLEANPNLTWRDVKMVLAQSARKTDASDAGWFTNAAGYHHNNKYGFGAIDAKAAVDLARNWVNLPAQVTPYQSGPMLVNSAIGTLNGTTRSVFVPNNFIVEHVEVQFTGTHESMGQIAMELTGPSGTKSEIAPLTANDDDGTIPNFTYGSVRYLGENSQGTWTLKVTDVVPGAETGNWNNWRLNIYGYVPDGGVVPNPNPPVLSNGKEDSRYETNEGRTTATNLGTMAGTRQDVVNLAIRSRTDRDWFTVTTNRSGQFTAEIQITGNPIIHFKLYTWDARTRKLTEVGKGQGTKLQPGGIQRIQANVAAGVRLYVQVYGYQRATGNYNLTLKQL